MTTYICTLYYPPGDTHDLPRSVLLPSGPIKRPSQHSVAIWQLLSSSPSEEERGLRGGEGGVYKCILFQPISWYPVFFLFSTRNHVYVCTCRDWPPIYIYTYTQIHTHIYIYIYMHTPSYIYTCMYLRMYIHGCICMRVCGWDWVSCMDTRVYRGGKRLQDRYSEMDVCDQRLGLGKDLREQSINDIKCSTC